MSLHAILEAIRSTGDSQVAELEARAAAQASQILAGAQLEAEQIQEQSCAAAVEPGVKERARILQRARLEALRITGAARKELVDTALERAYGRLAGIRSDPHYREVLRRLLQEALSELSSPSDGIHLEESSDHKAAGMEADPRDRQLLDSLLGELGLDLPVSYTLECWGGLVARGEGGRVVVINTLEARLEKLTPYLRSCLARLFEEQAFHSPRPAQAG